MIRVVLDTSVLVSAVISPTGPNAQVLDLIAIKQLRPCVTEAVLEEYSRVFEYERLRHLDRRRIARLRHVLERAAIKVKARGRLRISGHEEDNRIYECAVAAKANYIVTRLEAPGEERLLEWCSQYGLLGILLHRVETVIFPAETRFPRGLSGNVPMPVATRLERTNSGWRILDIVPFLHPPKPGAYLRRKLGEFEITFESLSESWAHYFPGVSADDRDSYQYPPVFGPEFWRQYAEPVSEFVGAVKMFREAVDDLRNLGSQSRPSPEQIQRLLRAERVIHALSEPVRPMLYRTGSGYGLGWACHSLLGTFAMMAMLDLSGARLIECANPSCRSLFVSKALKAKYCNTSCRGTEQVRRYRNRQRTRQTAI